MPITQIGCAGSVVAALEPSLALVEAVEPITPLPLGLRPR
jgi:hypothetical protein